jgi:hypothetical protein
MWNRAGNPRGYRRTFRPLDDRAPFALETRLLLAADVLTYHNDTFRTGENLDETRLTPANVNVDSFGKLGGVLVDGAVFAQPLIKTGVAVPGQGVINVLYIATENDSVYAVNADTLAPLWQVNFTDPAHGVTPVSSAGLGFTDIVPAIGITSTPVIDPATNAIYVVAQTQQIVGKSVVYSQTIHALNLATGVEQAGGPELISATIRGNGVGSRRGLEAFQARYQLQRSALLLDQGVVYVGWSSFADVGPYHGWVMGYDASNLHHQVVAMNLSPNGKQSSIWMSGSGPAADASGAIYVSSGNGTTDTHRFPRNLGDSVVKLAPGSLGIVDYFTPANQAMLNKKDLDLGSGGVLLLPDQPGAHPHLLVTGGKQGTLYVINRDQMGQYNRKVDRVVQELPGAMTSIFSTPAYFDGTIYDVGSPAKGSTNQTVHGTLEAFPIVNGLLQSPTSNPITYGYAGSTPSISANGTANGIVWTLDNSAILPEGPAILRAYDAKNIANELYASNLDPARDQAGNSVKFTVPTVANGKVYVGGFGVVTVYGLLGSK